MNTSKNYVGLYNLNNTCYINTGLQVMNNVNFLDTIKNFSDNGILGPLKNLLSAMKKGDNTILDVDLIRDFISTFRKQADEEFGDGKQNDSPNFINEIINLIDTQEFVNKFGDFLSEDELLINEKDPQKAVDIIRDKLAEYKHLNMFWNINKVGLQFELFPFLDIPENAFQSHKSIQSIISYYIEKKAIILTAKHIIIKIAPNNSHLIRIEESILIELDKSEYNINSIIYYIGSGSSGHYYCCVKNGSRWVLCNDEQITLQNDFAKNNIYALVYEKTNENSEKSKIRIDNTGSSKEFSNPLYDKNQLRQKVLNQKPILNHYEDNQIDEIENLKGKIEGNGYIQEKAEIKKKNKCCSIL